MSKTDFIRVKTGGVPRFRGFRLALLAASLFLLSLPLRAQTELGSEDDLTVLGTNGTALDPDVELKGFTVFGSTQAAYPGAVVGPGDVVVNGALAVSSGAYFTGVSTFSTGMYVMTAASFTDVANIYITGGADNQVLAKNGANGPLKWTNTSALGDDLGNHIATQGLDLAGNPIFRVSSLTITGLDAQAASLWVATSAVTPHLYVSTTGYVGLGTSSPSDILHIKKQLANVVFGAAAYGGGPGAAYAPNLTFSGTSGAGPMAWDGFTRFYYTGLGFSVSHNATVTSGPNLGPAGLGLATGGRDNDLFIDASGNVGIGSTAPAYRLTVSSGAGEAGTIMAVSTGATSLFWVAGDGAHAMKYYGDGSGLTGVMTAGDNLGNHIATQALQMGPYGVNSSSAVTAAYYQIAGSTVLALNGAGSTGVGLDAGRVNAGNRNSFVGYQAGYNNAGAIYNTFLGGEAGHNATSGGENTYVGAIAGYNTNGTQNSYFGSQTGSAASGNQNSFFGANSGASSNTGSGNSFFGYIAGGGNTSGSNNVFFGINAGASNTTGSGNIVIGSGQNASAAGAANELNLGGVLFGNLSAKTIGISTRAPQAALDIVSTGTAANIYAQIWRDGGGVVVGSMSATGVMTAAKFIGDGTGLTGVGSSAGASNLLGGLANEVPYQTAANTTAFTAQPGANMVLFANSGAPGWTNAPALTGTNITSIPGGNVTGSVASSTNSDKLDGYNASDLQYYQSDRDFPAGTLIQSNIDYSVANGEPFLLEIDGNSYNSAIPFDIKVQGYIYSGTIISTGGISNGTNLTGLVAFNYLGKLCFWFPSQGYWQGFNVNINDSYGGIKKNRLVSISNTAKPGGVTKEVAFTVRQSLHDGNFNSYAPTLTGTGASGSWPISITGTSAGAAPSGAAGGNLSGTYPNPSIASLPAISGAALTSLTAGNISAGTAGISVTGSAASATRLDPSGQYVWTSGTLAQSLPLGITNSFVRASDGWPEYGTLINARAYSSGGGGGLQLYAPYGSSYGGTALRYRTADYTADSVNPPWTAFKTILDSGNFNTYAPTLTGTGASGTWPISISGTSAGAAPSGAAGGNLSGTYPNPSIASLPAISGAALTSLTAANITAGTAGINITGSAGSAAWATYVSAPDGDRNAATKLPTTTGHGVRFDFVGAGGANGGGNYAGVMTYAPWDGTTASTGDSSYQLAFNSTLSNGGGLPYLSLRKGIDSTWNAWYTLLHSGNFNTYAPTLTGTGASGTWPISISGTSAGAAPSGAAGGALSGTYPNPGLAASISLSGSVTAATYLFPPPTGDPSPVITARVVPAGQGAANEKTELILFHSNDNVNGSGVDQITLRAPGLSFQTYNDSSVTDINNNLGYNERMYISPTGAVNIPGNLTVGGTLSATAANSIYQGFQQHTNDWTADFNSVAAANRGWAEQSTGGPQGTWWFMENLRHSNGSNYWGTQLAWGWEDNANQLWQRNVSAGSWSGWVKYLNSGNFNSYAPTLTGTGASGTWPINITGSAGSANLVNGTYTGGGGLQPPSYIPNGQVRFNMMAGVPGTSGYQDWLMMDTYTGGDVPYVTMLGVSKTAGAPVGYIAVGAKGGATWASTPLITGSNIASQSVSYASTSGNLTAGATPTLGSLTFSGVGGDSGQPAPGSDYRIYQAPGPWSMPYPDLNIAWHTGISIGAHYNYGGTRFFNNSDMVTELMSVGNGDNNVRVANNLTVKGSMEHYDAADGMRTYRNLATYNYSGGGITGTMKITLPFGWTNTMMTVTIKGYDYTGNGAWEITVGGYNYQPSSAWVNYNCTIKGTPPSTQVRLGYDGSRNIILLGNTGTSWSYPKLEVAEVMVGHSNYTLGWGSGWSITNIGSEAGFSSMVTAGRTDYTVYAP